MPLVLQVIGFIGTALVVWAYVPQINHLLKEHCSAGISRQAYTLWFVGALFLLLHAVMIRDTVFMFLQGFNALATLLILIYAGRYKYGVCPSHLAGQNPL